jgi:hypothetical protein
MQTRRARPRRTKRARRTRRNNRSRRAGMFRNAARHARRLSGELGKELMKDLAEKSFKAALRKDKGEGLARMSSGKLKRAKSRLEGASIKPMDLSTQFESFRPLSPSSPMTPATSLNPQ